MPFTPAGSPDRGGKGTAHASLGRTGGASVHMKTSQAIEEFKNWRGFKVSGQTVVRYDNVLRIFCLCMGDPDIERIQIQHVLQYMQGMEKLGWKRNGITIVALALRKFFEFYNLRGYKCLNEYLIPLPRKEFNLPRVANEKDYKKLLKAIPRDRDPNNIRNRALITLIWDTWARSGEIISLNEDHLVFQKDLSGTAIIKTEKSRGRRPIREIFWTKETGRNLKKWLNKKHELQKDHIYEDSDAVFVSIRKCGAYDSRGKRMTNRGVCEVLRTISNRADLPTVFNAHSARHYGGREIIKQGGSNADVSNILGHSSLDSSMIYTMMWGEELRERYDQFRNGKKVDLKHLTGEQALNAFLSFIQKGGIQRSPFIGHIGRKTEIRTKGGGKFTKF
jgi:site-specific recombinase XerD